jgi:hypothetical protein
MSHKQGRNTGEREAREMRPASCVCPVTVMIMITITITITNSMCRSSSSQFDVDDRYC